MRTIPIVKLLIVFAVAFSLASLTGPMSGNFHLPTVPVARALPEPCTQFSPSVCSQNWYPAGSAMNTLLETIYTDETAEYTALKTSPSPIDLTDWEATPSDYSLFTTSNAFYLTSAIGQVGYYEIEFHLGNVFWNCAFAFGQSACGQQVRQGLAHMLDKTQFCANQANVKGVCTPIDNPVPTTSAGGLTQPDPCLYDTVVSFHESGTRCQVGAVGGTSYNIATATGANGKLYLQAPGSTDLNAAAQHFVNAGIATGFNPATSQLTGINTISTVPNFFIRSDNPPRKELGESMAAEICYLFTGLYTIPCTGFLTTTEGPITAFPGFTTSKTAVNENWWMYTAAFSGPTFFDGSLYFGYNSHFVSGIPSIQVSGGGTCSNASVPTASAGDYQYACNTSYDSLSQQMEFASCLSAAGDPAVGATGANDNLPTGPGNGLCADGKLSAISAGIQAEAAFSANVLTLPVFELNVRYGYLNNGFTRVVNNAGAGIPNFFTWLDAWSATPAQAGTVRQGFKETTKSVNPYIASTVWDTYVEGNIYDSLFAANPILPSQTFNWMTYSMLPQTNATVITTSGYTPPAHTLLTYHGTLRNDLNWQDGTQVTAYDIAFSYLSMVGSGAFGGTGASTMTGITVLGPRQFDIGVNSLGPFTLANLAGITIQPGRFWTNAGFSAWNSALAAANCANSSLACQYTLSGPTVNCAINCATFPASVMTIDPLKTAATYDPIANHILVGSGPWTCGTVTSSGSGSCSSSGSQNPPIGGSYTLTRFGVSQAPGGAPSGTYFHSSGNAALWIWSQDTGNQPTDLQNFAAVAFCYQKALNFGSCAHFQQGIGAGLGQPARMVDLTQVSTVNRFFGNGWIQETGFSWASNPPLGIAALTNIVLYEGSVTLSPASLVGCPAGYDC